MREPTKEAVIEVLEHWCKDGPPDVFIRCEAHDLDADGLPCMVDVRDGRHSIFF